MTILPKYANETCPHCQTIHRLAVDVDEDGPFVAIDVTPCACDDCTVKLCTSCPQFVCSICRLTECAEHATTVDGEVVCPECVELMKREAAENLLGVIVG